MESVCETKENVVIRFVPGKLPLVLSSKIRVLSHVLRNKSSLFGRQKIQPPPLIFFPLSSMAFTLTAISSFAFPLLFLPRARLPSRSRREDGKEMVTNHPSSLPFLAVFSGAPPPSCAVLFSLTRIPKEVTFLIRSPYKGLGPEILVV